MSKHAQGKSQDSTPSDTSKSPKPAQVGDTPPRLPDASSDKATPVKAIHFWQPIKWPDLPGAGVSLVVGKPANFRNNVLYCESIFLYRGDFIVDGRWFMPKTSGAILNWEY